HQGNISTEPSTRWLATLQRVTASTTLAYITLSTLNPRPSELMHCNPPPRRPLLDALDESDCFHWPSSVRRFFVKSSTGGSFAFALLTRAVMMGFHKVCEEGVDSQSGCAGWG